MSDEEKKKRFKVVYALSYEVDADTPEEAEEEAFKMFVDDAENAVKFSNLAETFGANIEEITKTWTISEKSI